MQSVFHECRILRIYRGDENWMKFIKFLFITLSAVMGIGERAQQCARVPRDPRKNPSKRCRHCSLANVPARDRIRDLFRIRSYQMYLRLNHSVGLATLLLFYLMHFLNFCNKRIDWYNDLDRLWVWTQFNRSSPSFEISLGYRNIVRILWDSDLVFDGCKLSVYSGNVSILTKAYITQYNTMYSCTLSANSDLTTVCLAN